MDVRPATAVDKRVERTRFVPLDVVAKRTRRLACITRNSRFLRGSIVVNNLTTTAIDLSENYFRISRVSINLKFLYTSSFFRAKHLNTDFGRCPGSFYMSFQFGNFYIS